MIHFIYKRQTDCLVYRIAKTNALCDQWIAVERLHFSAMKRIELNLCLVRTYMVYSDMRAYQ